MGLPSSSFQDGDRWHPVVVLFFFFSYKTTLVVAIRNRVRFSCILSLTQGKVGVAMVRLSLISISLFLSAVILVPLESPPTPLFVKPLSKCSWFCSLRSFSEISPRRENRERMMWLAVESLKVLVVPAANKTLFCLVILSYVQTASAPPLPLLHSPPSAVLCPGLTAARSRLYTLARRGWCPPAARVDHLS